MRTSHISAALFVVGTAGVVAQTPAAPAEVPRFEVASFRPMDPSERCVSTTSPYGQPTWTMGPAPLRAFVQTAFEVTKLEGLPSWDREECFVVAAKAEDGVLLSREELRPRLRQLLAERLRLVTHVETTMTDGFALVVAKGGAKLTTSDKPLARTSLGAGRMRNPSVNMDFLAGALGAVIMQPVMDETGLAGTYDLTLTFAPEGTVDSPLPSIFTALQEQLGLRLEGGHKVAVPTLVIDHVEKPREN